MDKVRKFDFFGGRRRDAGFGGGFFAFQQISHVFRQNTHILHSLLVLPDFVGRTAVNHVPIPSRSNGHFGNLEIFVQLIQRRRRSRASGTDDRGAGFVAENVVSGAKRRKESPIHKRNDNAGSRRVMHGRSDDVTVEFRGFVNKFVDFVVENAFADFGAGAARRAGLDGSGVDVVDF